MTGDTVLVEAGTYTGTGNKDLDFDGRNIVLLSERGPEATIIDCEGSPANQGRALIFQSGERRDAVVAGFTIRDGSRWGTTFPSGYGGGMLISGSGTNPTIINCIFEANFAQHAGGGLAIALQALPDVRNCVFRENQSNADGGGAYVSSSAVIRNCEFHGNEAALGGNGAGLRCSGSNASPVVRDCLFEDNIAMGGGGGVYCSNGATVTVAECTFIRNHSNSPTLGGGGVYVENEAELLLSSSVFKYNTGQGGGTVMCDGASAAVDACTFFRNGAPAGQVPFFLSNRLGAGSRFAS